jgi:threonine aldolase
MSLQVIDFRSDNSGCAAPELIEAINTANRGTALGYGGDALTLALQDRLQQVFETPLRVFPVPTGTAANAVALAASCTPFGAVYCSALAHINTSECNATSFFGGGTKIVAVDGPHGKVDAKALQDAILSAGIGQAHKNQPCAVNLVQATDMGAIYQNDEVSAVSAVAHEYGLKVHMDGARFANALVALECTPAQASWRSGVDLLSLGVTKNGGLLTDAIVVFAPDTAVNIEFHLRRAGLVWSKMRFASAQVMAYVENDLWLRLARQANLAAARISAQIDGFSGVRLVAPVQANELFVELPQSALAGLERAGVLFHRRGPAVARFVCRWDTTEADCAALCAAIEQLLRDSPSYL